MSTISLRSSRASPAGLRAAPARVLSSWQTGLTGIIDRVLSWHERARERRQLLRLSDQMLRDIGVGRADVEAEASKPFWRS
jgi:uncharacterized protein YjiS (DUF1127 family)